MSNHSPLYPLCFDPIYKEKVWGGRNLTKIGRSLPGGDENAIGESWELVDLGTTMASGGGGGSERSVVTNGPLTGKTLHELMQSHGPGIMGDVPPSELGEFPLLVKFLDANENLSVQVHPSPQYAEDNPGAFLKSECWYIVDRQPGAKIYKGIKEGVTPAEFQAALEANSVEALVPLMVAIEVQPGECHFLPSGTCHALGEGVLVAEVQTPSDTTYRVFDWGRTGRELHIEQAMACIHFGPAQVDRYEVNGIINGPDVTTRRLIQCEYFALDEITAPNGYTQACDHDEPFVWTVLEGEGELTCDAGVDVTIQQGQTLLLPPGMTGCELKVTKDMKWLESSFPQARHTQIA